MRVIDVAALLLGVAWAVACAVAAGWSLGAFIGPLAGAAVVVPMLGAGESRRGTVAVVSFFCIGVGAVWIGGVIKNAITLPQWISIFVLLLIVAFAFSTVARALDRFRSPADVAGTIGVVVALAWLAAPFWLPINVGSPRVINAMVATHPVFAMNALLPQFGEWTELPATYHLTRLGQDVAYRSPTSAWGAMLLHGAIGCAGLFFVPRRSNRKTAVIEPAQDELLR